MAEQNDKTLDIYILNFTYSYVPETLDIFQLKVHIYIFFTLTTIAKLYFKSVNMPLTTSRKGG